MPTEQKSVFITGANGGVGSAAVDRLARAGWYVFAGVRSLAGADQVKQTANVQLIEIDICDEASIARARDEIARQLDGSGLDALVNNAGLSADGPLELVPIAALKRQFEVNVVGQIAVTQAFLPLLRQAHGRIVNIGGAAGRMTLPMFGALSASKAALDTVSDALRMELKHQGVQVSYIEPGALRTEFFEKSTAASAAAGFAGTPDSQAIYTSAIEASRKALAKSPADPVDIAAKAIARAVTARKPSARYVVGRQAKMGLFILPKLPASARDRMLMSSLGLKAAVFPATAPARDAR